MRAVWSAVEQYPQRGNVSAIGMLKPFAPQQEYLPEEVPEVLKTCPGRQDQHCDSATPPDRPPALWSNGMCLHVNHGLVVKIRFYGLDEFRGGKTIRQPAHLVTIVGPKENGDGCNWDLNE